MNLSDIEIKQVNPAEERIQIFNTYARSYNKCDSKISFTAELTALKEGYRKQADSLREEIDGKVSALVNTIERLSKVEYKVYNIEGTPTRVPSAIIDNDDLETAVTFIIDRIHFVVDDLKEGNTLNIERLKRAYQGLLDEVSYQVPAIHFRLMQGTFQQCIQYFKIKTHADSLGFLINQIGSANYPESLRLYEELSDAEKLQVDDRRSKPGYDEQKAEAIKFYAKNKDSLHSKYNSARKIGKAVRDHLKTTFPNHEKIISVTQLRKDVLDLTS